MVRNRDRLNLILHMTVTAALFLWSLNITIPMWIATLAGNDRFTYIMTDCLGVYEQVGDLISSVLITVAAIVSIAIMVKALKNVPNKRSGKCA